MSKVIMMCGVCGSGKTTYAKKKEQEGYIRLSIDEEMWKLYGRKGIDYPEEQYEKLSEQVEAALQKKLLSLIQQGKDVVIDFSFWSKENRKLWRFPELSLFYRLSSPLDSEMICIFPYFCPCEESAREIREILCQSMQEKLPVASSLYLSIARYFIKKSCGIPFSFSC